MDQPQAAAASPAPAPAPTTATAPARVPDAVIFPVGWRSPGDPDGVSAVDHVLSVIEPILGGGHAVGKPGWIRDIGNNRRLVTLDPADTLLYPSGHPLEKHPRYDWVPQSSGLQYGYLKDPKSSHAQA